MWDAQGLRDVAEIVNLRRVRKRMQRTADDQAASENRVRFGRNRAESANDATTAARASRKLDGARVESGQDPGGKTPDANRANDRDTTS